jgi:hypothetical protein
MIGRSQIAPLIDVGLLVRTTPNGGSLIREIRRWLGLLNNPKTVFIHPWLFAADFLSGWRVCRLSGQSMLFNRGPKGIGCTD